MRFFNTAGPIVAEMHYHVPPLERLDLDEIMGLVGQAKYFVLHAPRQTGKTSCLLALMHRLNGSGAYRCLYVNVETGQAAREDVGAAMRAVLSQLASRAEQMLNDRFMQKMWSRTLESVGPHDAFREVLGRWAEASPEPLVLMIDEVDALIGDTLIALLRQLRAGYDQRPRQFPQCVVLCGVRDVRDYRIRSSVENATVTGGSAFNIRTKSMRLGNFSEAEVRSLLAQHTEETGQAWEESALQTVWDLTQGQPWLVNALAYEACFDNKAGRDRRQPIDTEHIHQAREQLILRRETHLDQLAHKLGEERVRRVIEPLLSSAPFAEVISNDDLQYVRDLGLVHTDPPIRIANPIYREAIPRDLTYTTQEGIPNEPAWYVDATGALKMEDLLSAFQTFFREHSEHWVERFQYKEAGPQLLLQAFLQRIVNSGGRIEREYGLGRMRTDLLIVWPVSNASDAPKKGETHQKVVIECKLLRGSLEQTLALGLTQTRNYMDRCAAAEGHLVIFDRDPAKPWADKAFRREEQVQGNSVTVWGM